MAGADGAGDAGPIADRASSDLLALERRLLAQIRRLLANLDTKRGSSVLERDQQALATASQVRQQIVRVLEERGIRGVFDIAVERTLEASEAIAKAKEVPIVTSAKAAIDRIVRGQTADILDVFGVAANDMRQAVNTATTMGGTLADLNEVVAQRLNTSIVRAQAAVDSAVMAAGRVTLMDGAAATGLDYVFVYIGPRDGKTRPFCKQLLGRAFTSSAMSRLNNGAGLPVREYCGGYQCRHSWSPMVRAEARRDGIEIVE